MKIKKVVAFVMCMIIAFTAFACVGSPAPNNPNKPGDGIGDGEKEAEYVSLLTDKNYENGFMMRGLGKPIYNDPIETFGPSVYDPNVKFQYEKQGLPEPEWNLCQWATRYPFHDINNSSPYLPESKFNYKFDELSSGVYKYTNSSKNMTVNTNTGEYSLGLKSSECYREPRKEGQEWPHWFTEKRIHNVANPPIQCSVAASESIKVTVDVKVNSFVDNMGDAADPMLHSAMCVFYLFIANRDPKTTMFTDMLWFGITIFDNRYVLASLQSFPDVGSKESASEKWIYNIAGSEFFDLNNNLKTPDNQVIIDEWRTVDVDVLGHINSAFKEAQRNGYMEKSKWENLYINGMYCGYETPGNYDIDMSFKNLDIQSLVKV